MLLWRVDSMSKDASMVITETAGGKIVQAGDRRLPLQDPVKF
jgi:hypothetical protein